MLGDDFWKETLLLTFPNTPVFVSLSFTSQVPPNICAYKLKLRPSICVSMGSRENAQPSLSLAFTRMRALALT